MTSAPAAAPGPLFADPVAALDGMPFIDDSFAHKRLLAAVADVRKATAHTASLYDGPRLESWLSPGRAALVTRTSEPQPGTVLTRGQRSRVDRACRALGAAIPAWRPLVRLPVRFALLHPPTGATSASVRTWPQHVLLAAEAFTGGPEALAALVAREMAHQWLYLMEEVCPTRRGSEQAPPGTNGRFAVDVLAAAHADATLIGLHRTVAGAASDARVLGLREHGLGCLALLRREDLTAAGCSIAHRLREALASYARTGADTGDLGAGAGREAAGPGTGRSGGTGAAYDDNSVRQADGDEGAHPGEDVQCVPSGHQGGG
ncbi:hypothetical protein [Actinomadura algeriensis]|uniref:HEXXH motif-containing protein n=1 Tax=Actinomadura algeriensis TaxID=1679523 RepID=A0ABR9JQN2_9ACTN|nr:hypothetical protein [Actinomadura algeriensis]MBE1532880.1 hypothetical protein [Actinomadura algeriensis]